MADFSGRHWTSPDGLSLFARDYADKSGSARLPVVCLHGLTRNSKDFEDIAPRIASWGRRVIVPDIQGYDAFYKRPIAIRAPRITSRRSTRAT